MNAMSMSQALMRCLASRSLFRACPPRLVCRPFPPGQQSLQPGPCSWAPAARRNIFVEQGDSPTEELKVGGWVRGAAGPALRCWNQHGRLGGCLCRHIQTGSAQQQLLEACETSSALMRGRPCTLRSGGTPAAAIRRLRREQSPPAAGGGPGLWPPQPLVMWSWARAPPLTPRSRRLGL